MYIPVDVLNLITDYYVSMMMFETKQKMHQEFRKIHVVNHLRALHNTTLTDGKFNSSFCLEILKYMNKHSMLFALF